MRLLVFILVSPLFANGQYPESIAGKALDDQIGKPHTITNEEYRMFTDYVKDSIARRIMGENISEEFFLFSGKKDNYRLNWKEKLDWSQPETREATEDMYLSGHERQNRKREYDRRKLNYKNPATGKVTNPYPDTLAWFNRDSIHQSRKSALANVYNWHSTHNQQPVVGLDDEKLAAYLYWLQENHNRQLRKKGKQVIYTPVASPKVTAKYRWNNKPDWTITNRQYLKFLEYARDSIARKKIGYEVDESFFFTENHYGERLDPPVLNWKKKLKWNALTPEQEKCLAELIGDKNRDPVLQVDVQYLVYEFSIWEYYRASIMKREDRSVFVVRWVMRIYPNSLTWTYEEDEYEIMKLDKWELYNWDKENLDQPIKDTGYVTAFSYYHWKFQQSEPNKKAPEHDYWIPTKQEWEDYNGGKLPDEITLKTPAFQYTINWVK